MKVWIVVALLALSTAGLVAQQQPAQPDNSPLALLEKRVNALTIRVNDLENQLLQGQKSEIPVYQRRSTSDLRVDGIGNNGWYLIGNDGSAWDVLPEDTKICQGWGGGQRLKVYYTGAGRYPYVLANTDRGGSNPEAVRAAYMVQR